MEIFNCVFYYSSFFILSLFLSCSECRKSIWSTRISEANSKAYSAYPNSMFKGSHVSMYVICSTTKGQHGKVKVQWILQELECMEELYSTETNIQVKDNILASLTYDELTKTNHLKPQGHIHIKRTLGPPPDSSSSSTPNTFTSNTNADVVNFQISEPQIVDCLENNIIYFHDESAAPYYHGLLRSDLDKDDPQHFTWETVPRNWNKIKQKSDSHELTEAWENGLYHFMLSISPVQESYAFNATVVVEMRGHYGYLPAILWPQLPVRGVLAFLYLTLGSVWIIVWARSHQHTLKIHIVIGGVGVAAALANVLSFVELSSMNSTGNGIPGLKWFSMFLTVIQYGLVQLVLMIVSTGYGITRPELNRMLVASAMLLSSLATVTNFMSFVVLDEDLRIKYSMPSVALGISVINTIFILVLSGWIMIFSIMTFVHLGRRKHSGKKVVGFTLFTVTCIVIFIASLVVLSLSLGFTRSCAKDWRLEWLFETFFSMTGLVLLVVLMWLWRPVDLAQTYAFTPIMTEENGALGGLTDDEEEEISVYEKVALEPMS